MGVVCGHRSSLSVARSGSDAHDARPPRSLLARVTRTYDVGSRTPKVTSMRRDLMDILACPLCKGELMLNVISEGDDEVLEGALTCAACGEDYPISDGIPNLLPPDLRREMEAETSGSGGGHE